MKRLFKAVVCAFVLHGAFVQADFNSDLGIDPDNDLTNELYASVPTNALLAAEFLPDGRMLALTQSGEVFLIPTSGNNAQSLFTIPQVVSDHELGALDIKADPDFSQNQYFYTTHSAPLGGGVIKMVLSRFVLKSSGAATLSTRTVLWQSPTPHGNGIAHVGGLILIGPDGKFYISIGDNLTPGNSQNLSTIYGSIIRLNRDGSIPSDNPFVNTSGAHDEIWAYGVRNPFRGSIDNQTGLMIVGDVGGNDEFVAREEVNIIRKGANYGWPLCEGTSGCPSSVTLPIFDYGHNFDGGCCENKAIVGGFVYRAGKIPFNKNIYLFADFSEQTMEWVRFDDQFGVLGNGVLDVSGTPNDQQPIWIEINPFDNEIYYINFSYSGRSEIRRIRYTGGPLNRPPTNVVASASSTNVQIGENVQLSGSATDPDGDSLQYQWTFSDGSNASGQTIDKQWSQAGSYTVSLRVSDASSSTQSQPLDIAVGGQPSVTITNLGSDKFVAGDIIKLAGVAADAGGNALVGDSLSWDVRQFHGDHEHPVSSGSSGTALEFDVATTGHDWQGDTGYSVYLTATSSNGLSSTTSLRLYPQKLNLSFNANQTNGVEITIDDIVHPLPYTLDTVRNFRHRISTIESLCIGSTRWAFESWSSGKPRTHVLEVSNTQPALHATFKNSGADGSCGTDSSKPQPPTQLSAVRYSESAAELFWQAGQDNPVDIRYRVIRDGNQVAEHDGRSYFDNTITAADTYVYQVIAMNESGVSSDPATVSIEGNGGSGGVLPAVANLKSIVYSQNVAELSWSRTEIANGTVRYEIIRDGSLIEVRDALSYFFTDLSADTIFDIVGVASDGRRSDATQITVSNGRPLIVQPPANLRVELYSSTVLELFWDRPADGDVESFVIYRNGAELAIRYGTSYFDPSLTRSTAYEYQVKSIDASGRRSNAVALTTRTADQSPLF